MVQGWCCLRRRIFAGLEQANGRSPSSQAVRSTHRDFRIRLARTHGRGPGWCEGLGKVWRDGEDKGACGDRVRTLLEGRLECGVVKSAEGRMPGRRT